jgi:predicted  nucleic acid-binding Zn-ribbon protein
MVKDAVLAAFKQSVALAMTVKDEMREVNKQSHTEQAGITDRLAKLSGKERQLTEQKARLFEDLAGSTISKEQYLESKSALTTELERIKTQIAELGSKVQSYTPVDETSGIVGLLEKLNQIGEVTMEMLSFIKRINVFSSERIEIHFTFADELARLGLFAEN